MIDIAIPARDLAIVIGDVRGCVENRTTVPILQHVHIVAKAGEISVRGTDLSLDIATRGGADVAKEGETTLNCDTLHRIASRFPKSSVLTLKQVDSKRVSISSGKAQFSLPLLDPVDFPLALQMDDKAVKFKMTAKDLLTILESTRWAAAHGDTRLYLLGVHLHVDGNVLTAVATDGHKLVKRSTALPNGAAEMPPIIIPNKALGEICSLLDSLGPDVEVTVAVDENRIGVKSQDKRLVAKLLDAEYVKYANVIPAKKTATATLDVRNLADALGRAATVYSRGEGKIATKLETEDGFFLIEAKNEYGDVGHERVPGEIFSTDCRVGLNDKYLAALLTNWPAETIDVQVTNPSDPILFTSGQCPEMLAVIMPMRAGS